MIHNIIRKIKKTMKHLCNICKIRNFVAVNLNLLSIKIR